MFGSESATAIAPIEPTGTLPSVIGVQVAPASVVRNTPPLGDAHVEGARLRRHAGHRRDAAAARGADQPVLQALEQRGVDAGHHRR